MASKFDKELSDAVSKKQNAELIKELRDKNRLSDDEVRQIEERLTKPDLAENTRILLKTRVFELRKENNPTGVTTSVKPGPQPSVFSKTGGGAVGSPLTSASPTAVTKTKLDIELILLRMMQANEATEKRQQEERADEAQRRADEAQRRADERQLTTYDVKTLRQLKKIDERTKHRDAKTRDGMTTHVVQTLN